MAERTAIEWADATWNPWTGCRKVSPGCKFCYAERDMHRFAQVFENVKLSAPATFYAPERWARRKALKPGARIFTCSWSDWFIEGADEWRPGAWSVIRATPQFTYLILTKRPENILERLPRDWGSGYPNVWLLVSAEDPVTYVGRWSILSSSAISAKVKGVSLEPLIKPLSLADVGAMAPEWVITGGESGRANLIRRVDVDAFRAIRDECLKQKIPYFHKQHGGDRKIGGSWGGRAIDGVEWNQFPRVSQIHGGVLS